MLKKKVFLGADTLVDILTASNSPKKVAVPVSFQFQIFSGKMLAPRIKNGTVYKET